MKKKKRKTNKMGKIIKTMGMVFTVDDDVWSAVFNIQCAFQNMERRACLNERLRENIAKFRRE